jgi:phenylalanyl-tRNA synthetase beta chain
MRFSEAWLREWVDPPLDTQTFAHQLTMAGLEVETIEPIAPPFSGVVIGQVYDIQPHPNANKLQVCQVAVESADQLVTIVCGANNVAVNLKVAVATIGAVLPNGMVIKKVQLRGVESSGMLCSAAELGLAESATGLLELPAEAPLGQNLRTWLQLDDQALTLNLTPDRGDCLSIAGIAREVAALNQAVPLTSITPASVQAHTDVSSYPVQVQAPAQCPQYTCRVLQAVAAQAPTPLWMRERLRRCGLRSLGAIIDVTNYVLLELGQPLHAFDADKVSGPLSIRLAQDQEALTLLTGETISLQSETLVIADSQGPIALAGIMGGASTAVDSHTTNILLESAFFTPSAIIGRSRLYGLHTDSSHRFERGVDPTLQHQALERATQLIMAIAGGRPGPIVTVKDAGTYPVTPQITLRQARIAKILGLELAPEQVEDILGRLQFSITQVATGWLVIPPASRFDLREEIDVIAELGRIHGYETIPSRQACATITIAQEPEMAFSIAQAQAILVARGYHEAITYSFTDPARQQAFIPELTALPLANPISSDLSVMRTGLWPSLLQIAQQNLARQQTRIRLFETGLCFFRTQDHQICQQPRLAGLALGAVAPEQWGEVKRDIDFFDIKNDLQAVLSLTGYSSEITFIRSNHPALHPGQSAQIMHDQKVLGWVGMLHPSFATQLDISQNCYVFELILEHLVNGPLPHFAAISKFPSLRRDVAIVVDNAVPYSKIHASIRMVAGDWLRHIVLFDLYQDQTIGNGLKSLALGFILQDTTRTLTDQEGDQMVKQILEQLHHDVGARLRQ